jgi:hypothetical protein
LNGQFELLHWIRLGCLRLLVARHGLGSSCDTGAIDEDSLLAVRIARSRECRCNLLIRGYIDFAEDAADFFGDLFAPFGIAVEHGHFRASPSKLTPSRLAKPRGRAGHDRSHSLDIHEFSRFAFRCSRLGAERRFRQDQVPDTFAKRCVH